MTKWVSLELLYCKDEPIESHEQPIQTKFWEEEYGKIHQNDTFIPFQFCYYCDILVIIEHALCLSKIDFMVFPYLYFPSTSFASTTIQLFFASYEIIGECRKFMPWFMRSTSRVESFNYLKFGDC